MGEIALLAGIDDLGALYATEGAIDRTLNEVETAARALVPDTSTARGRAEIKSTAYDVIRSKTALDQAGKDLTEGWRAKTAAVNATRKQITLRLDTLATEIRQPLTDWEAREEKRKDRIAAEMRELEPRGATTAAELAAEIERVEAIATEGWDEFAADGARRKESTLARLRERHETKLENERMAAELVRLRAEKAERARIAAEEQAERDRIAAEEKERADAEAKRVADEAAEAEATRRAAEEKEAEAERQRVAAEERRQREEAEREEREARAEQEAQERELRAAEQARREAEERAQEEARRKEREAAEAVAAAERRAREAEAAAQAEREAAAQAEASRVAREQKERDERLAREADELHRAEVRAAIYAHMLAAISTMMPEVAADALADDAMANRIPFLAVQL